MWNKKGDMANLIIGTLMAIIGLVIFIAAFPILRDIINMVLAQSIGVGLNLIIKSYIFFGFLMFILLFFGIFMARRAG